MPEQYKDLPDWFRRMQEDMHQSPKYVHIINERFQPALGFIARSEQESWYAPGRMIEAPDEIIIESSAVGLRQEDIQVVINRRGDEESDLIDTPEARIMRLKKMVGENRWIISIPLPGDVDASEAQAALVEDKLFIRFPLRKGLGLPGENVVHIMMNELPGGSTRGGRR
jgi:HSP20 family molecular chaperone IbpA